MSARQWGNPHPLDKWGQEELVLIAHSAGPPDSYPQSSSNWSGNVTLPAANGWQVCFFYDCGELDYIEHFVTPSGEKLEVWPNEYDSDRSPPIMLWRGTSSTLRILNQLPKPVGALNAVASGACVFVVSLPFLHMDEPKVFSTRELAESYVKSMDLRKDVCSDDFIVRSVVVDSTE